jgi:hypothetical protein
MLGSRDRAASSAMNETPRLAREIEDEYGKTALEGLQKIDFRFEDEPVTS